MTDKSHRVARLVLAVAAGAVAVGACSSNEVPEDQVIIPQSAPSGWEVSTFEGVSVATPGGWEESTGQDAEYEATTYSLQTERNDFGTRGGVQVAMLDAPQGTAEEAVDATETGYQANFGVSDVEKEQVEWPGAEAGWFLSFVADGVPNDDGQRAPHQVQLLVLDLAGGSQVQATVTALADEFDELRMNGVLPTVTLE